MRRFIGFASIVLLLNGLTLTGQSDTIIPDVRARIAKSDFTGGEALIADYRARNGVTPTMLEALSWLGRGALAANRLEDAERYARETHVLSLAALKNRGVDDEEHLPTALGAAIEVQAQAAAAGGDRSIAVQFLRQELNIYSDTSLHKRIQKNINLLSLEGQPAPALDLSEYLGPKPPAVAQLKGQVVIMFFWAHWCSDCKAQGPILEGLLSKYGAQGLTIVAPTQRFGYAARGRTVSPDEERRYIAEVLDTSYGFLSGLPVPLAEANHKQYGVSSTPTLVVLDRDGRIELYNPGRMTLEELEPVVRRLLDDAVAQ
jgi:cytochrome c biogenesis protein CcmG/thiol:disulfide interchange protein DsbE